MGEEHTARERERYQTVCCIGYVLKRKIAYGIVRSSCYCSINENIYRQQVVLHVAVYTSDIDIIVTNICSRVL